MISVLIPSRGHPDLLERSVRSLMDTATAEAPEIIVRADDDDPATQEACTRLLLYAEMVLITGEPLGYEGLHTYYQEMAEAAHGDWLMVWNDDDQMLTPGWDEVIEALPPEVLVADPQNTHSPLCCVPAIRRSAIEALGRFSTANPHVDTCWQDIGRATGRIVAVPVRVSCDSPVKPHLQHGYYEAEHQAELAQASELIRQAMIA